MGLLVHPRVSEGVIVGKKSQLQQDRKVAWVAAHNLVRVIFVPLGKGTENARKKEKAPECRTRSLAFWKRKQQEIYQSVLKRKSTRLFNFLVTSLLLSYFGLLSP